MNDEELRSFETPDVARDGNSFTITWPQSGFAAKVSRLREGRDEMKGQIEWADLAPKHRIFFRVPSINLMAPTTATSHAREVAKWRPGYDWEQCVHQVVWLVIDAMRQGEPILHLNEVDTSTSFEWLIEGILPAEDTSIFFGDGGSMKSLTALAAGISVMTGLPFAGEHEVRQMGPVLYLDWESGPKAHARRLRRLCHGLSIDWPAMDYRFMSGFVGDHTEFLRTEVAKRGYILAIVDSLGWACGDEPSEAGIAIKTMTSLRSLGITTLCVAHVAKGAQVPGKRAKPTIFGSTFFRNAARFATEVRAGQAELDGSRSLQLINDKANDGPLLKPVGVKFEFEPAGGPIRYYRETVLRDIDVSGSLGAKIMGALRGKAMSAREIAAAINHTNPDSISAKLRQMKQTEDVRELEPAHGSREKRWGLAAPEFAGAQEALVTVSVPPNSPDSPEIATGEASVAKPTVRPEMVGTAVEREALGKCAWCDEALDMYLADGLIPVCAAHRWYDELP